MQIALGYRGKTGYYTVSPDQPSEREVEEYLPYVRDEFVSYRLTRSDPRQILHRSRGTVGVRRP